jgi:hypothetical protein
MHAESIGELARIHERERRRALATQELDRPASHGLNIVGTQDHDANLAK